MDEENLFEKASANVNPQPEVSTQNSSGQQNPNQPAKNVNYNTNYNTNYEKNRGGKGCLIAVIIVLVIIAGIFISIFAGISSAISGAFDTSDPYYYTSIGEDYVEVINVVGTITDDSVSGYGGTGYSHTTVLNRLSELINDSYNKGLILYFNSGGGGAYESDELYLALKSYSETTSRPIYAYYAQTSASGAVYASMAADEIYANRMTMTGSIGVVMSTYNISGLLENLGIEEINITSGENKAMLSSGTEVSDEQLAILQGIIDESYQIFANIVADERGIPIEKVYEIADGRLYSPEQALELDLIDGIMTYEEFLSYVGSKRALSNCILVETQYPAMPIWNSLLYQAGMESGTSNESDIIDAAIDSTQKSPLKFQY